MTYLHVAARLISALFRSPITREIGRYALRMATAAAVREVRRRTSREPKTMS